MNYGTLKQMVTKYLEVEETSFLQFLPQFIIQAEEEISRQVQLQDLMQTSTSSLIPGTPYLQLPADFLSPYSMFVLAGGQWQALLSKDHSFMREVYGDPAQRGVPRFYALFNEDNLMLGPTPDNTYEVELNYFYEPASLTAGGNDANETWISTNGENAILFGTILQGYIYLKGDQDVIKQYQEKFQSAIQDLKVIAEGRNRKDSYRKSDARIPV